MKIFVFIISTLAVGLVFSEENKISRSEHVKAFNEAQRCFNSTSIRQLEKKLHCSKRALERGRFLFEPESLNMAGLTFNYGKTLHRRDSLKSYEVLSRSLELYEVIYGKNAPEIIHVLIEMGKSSRTLSIAKKNFTQTSSEYAGVLLKLSMSDKFTLLQTLSFASSAYQLYLQEEGVESYNTAVASFQMGKIKFVQKKYKSAIPYLIGGTEHPDVASFSHGWLVRAYGLTDQDDLASYHAQQLGLLRQGQVDDEFIPVFEPNANYPQFAQRRGLEGYAVIELTISKEGSATDVVLIEESPESWGFGEEALKAGARLLYAPRFVNGEALEVPGVLYKYSFKMAN